MAELATAREAKERLRTDLGDRPGVRALGLTWLDPGWAIKVEVASEDDGLPDEVDGIPVQVEVVPRIVPFVG